MKQNNNTQPRIKVLSEKKLVGKSLKMSLATNKTSELWKSFMPKRKMIQNTIGSDLYSMQLYDKSLNFNNFNPSTEFTKCAMIETSGFENIPIGMDSFILEKGLYAIFIHKGLAKDFSKTFQYIFKEWLPNSAYIIDQRPHFELLGTKYNPNSENSEEEVWIPIKPREN